MVLGRPGSSGRRAAARARPWQGRGGLGAACLSPRHCRRSGVGTLLVFCNVTNKIRKRTDTAVAFTQEYYRVSYPLGNVSTLPTGSGCPRTHTLVYEDRKERTF